MPVLATQWLCGLHNFHYILVYPQREEYIFFS